MTRETKLAIFIHATRWSANNLTELLNNYGNTLTNDQRLILKDAISRLWDLDTYLRKTSE